MARFVLFKCPLCIHCKPWIWPYWATPRAGQPPIHALPELDILQCYIGLLPQLGKLMEEWYVLRLLKQDGQEALGVSLLSHQVGFTTGEDFKRKDKGLGLGMHAEWTIGSTGVRSVQDPDWRTVYLLTNYLSTVQGCRMNRSWYNLGSNHDTEARTRAYSDPIPEWGIIQWAKKPSHKRSNFTCEPNFSSDNKDKSVGNF